MTPSRISDPASEISKTASRASASPSSGADDSHRAARSVPAVTETAAERDVTPSAAGPAEPAADPAAPHAATKSVLGRYGRLPQLAGRSFLPLGLFARLPIAMLTVGALTLVNAVSGSVAIGGFAAGAVGVGSAIGAPTIGYLADRVGQRPVLLISAVANTVAILALIAASHLVPDFDGRSLTVLLAAAFGMGLTSPQVGPLARVRWMALTRNSAHPADLDTALSYESTADELTFVLGPALVGLLASLIAPWMPLALAALITLTLVSAFALHRTQYAVVPLPTSSSRAARTRKVRTRITRRGSELPAPMEVPLKAELPVTSNRQPQRPGSGGSGWWSIALPVLGMICMGTFFGGTQAVLIAFAGTFDAANAGGLLYAVMGVSSAIAALSVAYWPVRFSAPRRWLASAAAMAMLSTLLFLPTAVVPMLLVLFLLGISVGPTMVTIFSIGGLVAPEERLGTVMTMLASGIVVGTAIGSSVAGGIAESSGYSVAFSVSCAAAVGLLGLGLLTAKVVKQPAST